MATRDEINRAVGNVASGNASKRDIELTAKQAEVAGSEGNAARKAQKEAGKDKTKSWGNW